MGVCLEYKIIMRMKKLLLLFVFIGCIGAVSAQTKTVDVATAGTLSFSDDEKASITTLTVTGSINHTDMSAIKTLTAVEHVDLSGADIVAEGDYPANTIPAEIFRENATIKTFILPNSIVLIDEYAFYMCKAITKLDFSNCKKLKKIGYYACGSIQETLTSVSFNGCAALDTIDNYAFAQSKVLETIDFTGCVALKSIGNRAFLNCLAVKSLDLSPCTALTEITANGFRQMKGVETLKLPTTVTTIADNAFYQFSALTSVVCMNTIVPTVASDAFKSSPITGCTLTVPVGSKSAYEADAVWGTFASIVESASVEAATVEKIVAESIIYSISGSQISTLTSGVNIVKTIYTDGSADVKKVIVR